MRQNLHSWFARRYSRAEDEYRRACEHGDVKRMDEALAKKQELEKGITITVENPAVLQ